MDSINEFIDVEQQEPVNRGVGVASLLIKSCMGKQLKVSCSQRCRANPGKMVEFLLFLSFQPQVLRNLERPSQEAVNFNSAWHSIILLNAAESSQSALATECQEQEAADTCNSKQWVLGEPQPL